MDNDKMPTVEEEFLDALDVLWRQHGNDDPGYKAMMPFVKQIAELQAERDALAKDAARYRWLRERWGRVAEEYEDDRMTFIGREKFDGEGWYTDPDSVDAAIDAAMDEGER